MQPNPIDVDLCQRLFYIDNDFLRWKEGNGRTVKAGDLAGTYKEGTNGRGYIGVRLPDGKKYYAHRIIWAMRNGRDPGNMQIDHKEDIFVDFKGKQVLSNAKNNLRLATHGQNLQNRAAAGVYWNNLHKKWRAEIKHKGVRHYLGYFFCYEKARAAYLKAKNELHGRFTPKEFRTT